MITIAPSASLSGSISLPGDKSISHRASLFAALAEGESRIEHFLDAGVTRRMLAGLTALGVEYSLDGETLTVHGRGIDGLQAPEMPIDCGSSATTMRLLAGALAAAGIPGVLDGSTGLRRRPMNRILVPLREMGVDVRADEGRAPLTFTARRRSITPPAEGFHLKVASAQVKTCLLLAGLDAPAPTRIIEPGPSRDHTERMLRAMGARIDSATLPGPDGSQRYKSTLHPYPRLNPLDMRIPGDISSAAFLIVAALVTPGSDVHLRAVGTNPTRTGLLDALRQMGADIQVTGAQDASGEPFADLRVRYSSLQGTTISGPLVVRMIDEFPAFAVAAAYAEGETIVRDAVELRHKESDRIQALCTQLSSIGIRIEELPDGFVITGGAQPAGGRVRAGGDHRIAMATAIAGLAASGPVSLDDPAIIRESFPNFTRSLEILGANLDG